MVSYVWFPPLDEPPVVLLGDPNCNEDPCSKHGTCHCMCRCMPDQPDNCGDCAEAFADG